MISKNRTIIELSKSTLEKFQFSKMVWQSDNKKKITNDEYILILIEENH